MCVFQLDRSTVELILTFGCKVMNDKIIHVACKLWWQAVASFADARLASPRLLLIGVPKLSRNHRIEGVQQRVDFQIWF